MRAYLIATLLLVGCASLAVNNAPPALELRTLRISDKVPGFEYSWRECKKTFLGNCRKWELKTEYYDLTDTAVRNKLRDMGFVARVRDKVIP